MTRASQPQPSAKPREWPRVFPDTPDGAIGWEPIDLPTDDSDSDDTPPMPRPAVKIEERARTIAIRAATAEYGGLEETS